MLKKQINRQKRHYKILKRIRGTAEKPRLLVQKSLKNFHAQVINDLEGRVLFGVSTVSKDFRKKLPYCGNKEAAKALAKLCAKSLISQGVNSIAFDRGGFQYHGRVKVFAETLREEGINF